MLNHDVKGIDARILAKLCPDGYISAHNRLQAGANSREDISRANYYSANDAKILGDAEVGQLKGSGYHLMRDRITRWTNCIGRSLIEWISTHVVSFVPRNLGFEERQFFSSSFAFVRLRNPKELLEFTPASFIEADAFRLQQSLLFVVWQN